MYVVFPTGITKQFQENLQIGEITQFRTDILKEYIFCGRAQLIRISAWGYTDDCRSGFTINSNIELTTDIRRQFQVLLRQMGSECRVILFDDSIENGLLRPGVPVTTSVPLPGAA